MSSPNQPRYATQPKYPSKVLIYLVETPQDVSHAFKRATELGVKVGIRTSGHIFNVPGLIEGGILIDTVNLNRQIDYDPITQEVTFGPSCRVEELAARLQEVKRFFPHGHAPTVGSGGFLLAGGQG
ncbi:hypothetical protein ACHAPT_000630 [Fusarium lateritium]